MATWTGEAWLGSASGRQTVSVQSNTFHGAKEQIEQIYGATDVWNLREEPNNRSSSSSSGASLSDLFGLIVIGTIGMGVLSFFGGGDSDTYEPDTTTQPEQVQPRQSWSTNAPPALDVEAPFFVQDGIQEEVIDDLGQDWDN